MAPPAGFTAERWHRIVDAAGAFLDRWAGEAIAAGWSALDVFGADATAPDKRFDIAWGWCSCSTGLRSSGLTPRAPISARRPGRRSDTGAGHCRHIRFRCFALSAWAAGLSVSR